MSTVKDSILLLKIPKSSLYLQDIIVLYAESRTTCLLCNGDQEYHSIDAAGLLGKDVFFVLWRPPGGWSGNGTETTSAFHPKIIIRVKSRCYLGNKRWHQNETMDNYACYERRGTGNKKCLRGGKKNLHTGTNLNSENIHIK